MKSYTELVDGHITVTLVKQYAYCPMIPWIMKYMDYQGEATASMETGKEKATPGFKEEVARRLGLPRPYRIEYPVEYKPLGIKGIVDVIAGRGRLAVLEVKVYRRNRRWLGHFKTQLLTYAYIVEKTIGPVHEAVLYNGGEVVRVRPTRQHYNQIEGIIRNLSKALSNEHPPVTRQNPRKCSYCEYRRLCPNYY